jgi:hypothetical protein
LPNLQYIFCQISKIYILSNLKNIYFVKSPELFSAKSTIYILPNPQNYFQPNLQYIFCQISKIYILPNPRIIFSAKSTIYILPNLKNIFSQISKIYSDKSQIYIFSQIYELYSPSYASCNIAVIYLLIGCIHFEITTLIYNIVDSLAIYHHTDTRPKGGRIGKIIFCQIPLVVENIFSHISHPKSYALNILNTKSTKIYNKTLNECVDWLRIYC